MQNNKPEKSKSESQRAKLPSAVRARKRFWTPVFGAVLFLFVLTTGLKMVVDHFNDVVLPNTFIGDDNLGGMRETELESFLNEKVLELERNGLEFSLKQDLGRVYPTVDGVSDLDLSYTLYSFDTKDTTRRVFSFGKHGSVMKRSVQVVSQMFRKKQFSASYQLNEERLVETLKEMFSSHEQPTKQPRVSLQFVPGVEVPEIAFVDVDASQGKRLEYQVASRLAKERLSSLSQRPIPLELVSDIPAIPGAELLDPRNQLQQRLTRIVQASEIIFERPTTTPEETGVSFKIPREEFVSYLAFRKPPHGCERCPGVNIILNEDFDTALSRMEQEVNERPLDAKFILETNKDTNSISTTTTSSLRMREFQGSRDGRIMNRAVLIRQIETALNGVGDFSSHVSLPMETIKAAIETAQVNDLGIREIIGVGKSNFKGSPNNRRHNIAVGAAAVNGTLIAPGEEFSLLRVLGEVSKSSGYLPELVIKGDRTVPEYGGGLCQIGTTTFRGALGSGLPITARTNHSYRVSYYEPAGTDATIYDPAPDFKFLNDTGHFILIQTSIEGDEAIFEFWGTKDGRITTQTKPIINHIVQPPPTKYIETLDLKPGEQKCTERAHAGADAEFTYSVTYPDGSVKERVFTSHYRPWQAVCLKGVKELSPPEQDSVVD